MPRVAQPPRSSAQSKPVVSFQKSPTKMPLNDDRQEKSVRFKSRQALNEIHINSLKAAASPAKKSGQMDPTASPRTPDVQDKENAGSPGIHIMGANPVTPMRRVPILANFEEWMKMATDNKINATNSWNFALIDYFHDMSLLKEGDGVNFQKASCTLDGCVKIYTSRVDSVATETGKLLSGLADSGNNKKKNGDESGEVEGEDEEDGEEGEDGGKRKTKKRVQRSSEATLAPSFAQLQLKKMELEFSVDPLFKKASADFDEGGAKGLLLNHLTLDSHGRIVFDSSDDLHDEDVVPQDEEDNDADERRDAQVPATECKDEPEVEADIDIEALAHRFLPDLASLDEQIICPSLKAFELGGTSEGLDIPFLKAADATVAGEDGDAFSGNGFGDAAMGSYDDDDEVGFGGGFDVAEVGFGEGGEAWAREAAIETQPRPHTNHLEEEDDGQDVGSYEASSANYGVKLSHDKFLDQENILSYFDQALRTNWAGPEHWRIRKIKDASKSQQPVNRRKEKEPFEIDFSAPLTQAMSDTIFAPATSNSAISLPKSQWNSKTRNLLPDDKHFNSKQLLSLFLKPKARIGSRRPGTTLARIREPVSEGEMDEAFWAQKQQQTSSSGDADTEGPRGDYDANFFQDDGLGLPPGIGDDEDDEFADARENFSPGLGDQGQHGSMDDALASGSQEGGFGTQLVTQSRRVRPEYMQYARVAKKVDVRRLKEEMWKGIGFSDKRERETSASELATPPPAGGEEGEGALKFTSVMNGLQSTYPKQAMADISTSYCFICLLHLANEKGLILESNAGFEEIMIQKDQLAEITEVDA